MLESGELTSHGSLLGTMEVRIGGTLDDFVEVRADSSHKLNGRLIKASSDSGFTKDFLAKFGVRDSKRELLLFGRLG